MIVLETQFVSGEGGFSVDPLTYTQVARTAKVAIYERSRHGKVVDYEVFRIKIQPKGHSCFGKISEEDEEKYPSSGQFSTVAWSCLERGRAMQLYEELCREEEAGPTVKEDLVIPVGEFTIGELAEKNSMKYPRAFLWVKAALGENRVEFVREEKRNTRGKPSKLYRAIVKTT